MAIPSKPVRKSNGAIVELLEFSSATADADLHETTGGHRTGGYSTPGELPDSLEWSYFLQRMYKWFARLNVVSLFTDTVASHKVARGDDTDGNTIGLLIGSTTTEDQASGTSGDVRLQFVKETGAFRAGRVDGTQWNAGSSGVDSQAFGKNCSASGAQAQSSGLTCAANGDQSFAGGKSAVATGVCALAFGDGAWVTAAGGVALGKLAKADSNGVALGHSSYAGAEALALGLSATAFDGCCAVGPSSVAQGASSSAFGQAAEAHADASTALGYAVTIDALAVDSLVAGKSLHAGATSTQLVALGQGDGTAIVNSPKAVLIGYLGMVSASAAIAIGWLAQALAASAIALGKNAKSESANAIAIGENCNSKTGTTAMAMGKGVVTLGQGALGTGISAGAASVNADGRGARAHGAPATAPAVANGIHADAMGDGVDAIGDYSHASGAGAKASNRGEFARSSLGAALTDNGKHQHGNLILQANTTDDVTKIKFCTDKIDGTGAEWNPASSRGYVVTYRCIAKAFGSANVAIWAGTFLAVDNGGTLTLPINGVNMNGGALDVSGAANVPDQNSAALVGCNLFVSVSGGVIRFELDGVAATNIRSTLSLHYAQAGAA